MIKTALAFGGILLIFQLVSYYSFAESLLPEALVDHRRSLAIEEPGKVYFSCSQALSTTQVTEVTSKLEYTFAEALYGKDNPVSDSEELACFYSFSWQIPIPFYAAVSYNNVYQEERGGDAYAEGFESKYIWLLFFWQETAHFNTGQS
jgi:hypothetical protein